MIVVFFLKVRLIMTGKKILQVCSYYEDIWIYKSLFDRFEAKGMDYDLLFFKAKGKSLPPLPENTILSQAFNSIDRYVFSVKHRKVYNDIVTKLNPDNYFMSHAHSLMSNGYISYRLKQDYSIPYIVAVRNTDIFTFFRLMPHLIPLGRKIMNDAYKIIFISPKYKDYMLSRYIKPKDLESIDKKSIVISNGIDGLFLEDYEPKDNLIEDTIRLIFVGRVDDSNKNVRTLVKACDFLLSKGHKLKLTLVGRLEKDIYKKFILNRDYIEYLGTQDVLGVRSSLRNSDIFVMPSKHETFGLVYAEAMSQGLPVIYTKNQGFDGYYPEGQVGYHVVHNDSKQIADKILKIVDNYNTMSKNAIIGSKRFNWDSISDEYIMIYKELLEDK